RQAVWADVKRAAKAFRLPQNIAPHSFRKVYAVELLEKYGDIERVKRALNHSSVEVTMIYAMSDKLLLAKKRKL
ncbi:MAG: tyrosine-type recombinase/integrase, partial [Oscillospiraceae bacterium]